MSIGLRICIWIVCSLEPYVSKTDDVIEERQDLPPLRTLNIVGIDKSGVQDSNVETILADLARLQSVDE